MIQDDYEARMKARKLTNMQECRDARNLKWPPSLILPQTKADDAPPGGWKVIRIEEKPKKP